jgi:hypothetical protein
MIRQLPSAAAFGHAVSSVRNNLEMAFRLSWPWYAIVIPATLAVYIMLGLATGGNPQSRPGLAFFVTLLVGAITIVSTASIAVNWHRYILRDEVPRASQALRLDDVVWRYVGNMILIMFGVLAVVLLIALPANMIGALAGSPGFGIVLTFILAVPVGGTLFMRFAVKLPAIALARTDFSMRDAWQATSANNVPIFLLFLLNILVGVAAIAGMVAVAALFSLFGAIGSLMEVIVQVAVNWILTIFGITVLTSLYGFFVENRDF